MNKNDNLLTIKQRGLTSEEAVIMGRKGGLASVRSRRAKKTLSERIKLALTISTNENLKALKIKIKEVWPNRHLKDNKMELRVLLAQSRTIRDCGVDVYNILRIAQAPESQEMALKVTNALWDREEGKAAQRIESNITSEVKNTVVVTKEDLALKKKNMKLELLD